MSAGSYGALDRLLHRMAFRSTGLQLALADIDDRLLPAEAAAKPIEKPVFITGLPRAGTTLMLEILVEQPGFVSHRYRHMPFILTPLLWRQLSGGRKHSVKQERAHGDGIEIGYDSPEAFEEMLWQAHWPELYRSSRIPLWYGIDKPEFGAFFRAHIRKLLQIEGGARYVSKNNANIARLPALKALFPDAAIIIPFRNPGDHAQSLLNQHKRFLKRHAEDDFARAYMAGIGHHEFGAAIRPFAFPGFERDVAEAGEIGFWLDYWTTAYRHVLATAPDDALFVDYDALCNAPSPGLERLGKRLDLKTEGLSQAAARFRPGRRYEAIAVRSAAEDVLAGLQERV